MPKVIFVEADGNRIETEAEVGASLMKAAVNAGVPAIVAECGGAMACGTCHCYLADGWFARVLPPEEGEVDMLDFVIDPQADSRLSCQVVITPEMDGLIVRLPASQT